MTNEFDPAEYDPAFEDAKRAAEEEARRAAAEAEADRKDLRTAVTYAATREAESADAYEKALMRLNLPIYRTTDRLLYIRDVEVSQSAYIDQPNGPPVRKVIDHKQIGTYEITATFLDDTISRHIKTRQKDASGKVKTIPVPSKVSRTILARKATWKYPQLNGVISCPSLRPDGSLLITPGYDEETGWFLSGDVSLTHVDWWQKPSKEIALKALRHIRKLFREFPFHDPESGLNNFTAEKAADGVVDQMTISESVGISTLLTSVARAAFDVVPMSVTSAPDFGVGKTYLAELIVYIVTGKWPSVFFWSTSKEENDKLLASILTAGYSACILDNINGVFENRLLTQMITSKRPQPRLLGKNEVIEREQWMTILANGVNIAPSEDLDRRYLLSIQNPQMENPKHRVFKSNPRQMITLDRQSYISCALAMLRGYIVAGMPNPPSPLAGFERWSKLICGTMTWLDCPNPLESQKRGQKIDPKRGRYSALMAAIEATFGLSSKQTAGKLLAQALVPQGSGKSQLYEALSLYEETKGQLPSGRGLASQLDEVIDKIVDGKCLRRNRNSHSKQFEYWVENCG